MHTHTCFYMGLSYTLTHYVYIYTQHDMFFLLVVARRVGNHAPFAFGHVTFRTVPYFEMVSSAITVWGSQPRIVEVMKSDNFSRWLPVEKWGFPPSQPCIMLDDPWGDERWETGRRAQFRRSWRNTGDFLRTKQLDLTLNSGWKNANNYGDRFQKCLENSRTCSSIFRVAKVLCEKCREWWVVAREDLFFDGPEPAINLKGWCHTYGPRDAKGSYHCLLKFRHISIGPYLLGSEHSQDHQ